MSDVISFLLILPALVLGVAVLDSAGTTGMARYRTAVFAEAAAVQAADTLAKSPPASADPEDRARWNEVAAAVKQAGIAATAGICNQTDADFEVSLRSQPRDPRVPNSSPSVGAIVSCPVELGKLFKIDRIVSVGIEPVE